MQARPSSVNLQLHLLGVSKSFWRGRVEVPILRSVELAVRTGEFVAIMGASGSGKSTLLQLMGGLDTPTAGEVWVAGRRLDTLTEAELARFRLSCVGFVFQFFNLIPTLSAVENAALPLMLANTSRREALLQAASLLEELGLTDRRHHMPEELSGGEMQRVSMARAMLTRPPLLLADEPTGNLDSYAGEGVMRLLARFPRARGQTVVMVTHDARAAAYADRVVTLRDGAVAEATRAGAVLS